MAEVEIDFSNFEVDLFVDQVSKSTASELVIENHYLHRRPSISHAFALYQNCFVRGVITFGTPPSRHLQMSACPSDPSLVVECNRIWVTDDLPKNTESWFVSRALKLLPPLIVVSYADTAFGHVGYLYRSLNWKYAGWTDMERKTPRFDYCVPGKHSRDAFRSGGWERVRRKIKHKYWTTTGDKRERKRLSILCEWPSLDWHLDKPKA
jgi:hypothetical protein